VGKRNRQRQRDKNWRKQPQESFRDFADRRGDMAMGRKNGLSEAANGLKTFAFPFELDLPKDIVVADAP
jgi:hypothetical protein